MSVSPETGFEEHLASLAVPNSAPRVPDKFVTPSKRNLHKILSEYWQLLGILQNQLALFHVPKGLQGDFLFITSDNFAKIGGGAHQIKAT